MKKTDSTTKTSTKIIHDKKKSIKGLSVKDKLVIKKKLERLRELDKEISTLLGISALLSWDKDTIMPSSAFADRAEHLAYISTLIHSKFCSSELWKLVCLLRKVKSVDEKKGVDVKILDDVDSALVRKFYREAGMARKIPSSHVEAMARVSTQAFEAWTKARVVKDFSIFAPHLEKLVALKRKEAAYIDPSKHPYEVLLDVYEEGISLDTTHAMLSELKKGLLGLILEIKLSRRYILQKNTLAGRSFPSMSQLKLARAMSHAILGKSGEGRVHIGESIHPFMTRISGDDVRLTTAVRESEPMFAFGSVTHESGHALYELQIDRSLDHSILCTGTSTGLHESQSRLWENQICSSLLFWKGFYGTFQKEFAALSSMGIDEFFFQINQVKPSLIRIESDEVTYSMHIIIRYEIERALIDGTLAVKDAKQRWNELYTQYLGVVPAHDTEGILQDVHWTDGSFGYFPTYALGNVYSAMMFDAMKNGVKGKGAIQSMDADIYSCDFERIRGWLHDYVHKYGSVKRATTIVFDACGSELDCKPYLKYLRSKFGELYGLSKKI